MSTTTHVRPDRQVIAHSLAGLTPEQWAELALAAERDDRRIHTAGLLPCDLRRLYSLGLGARLTGAPRITGPGRLLVERVGGIYRYFLGEFDTGKSEGAEDWWICPCGNHPGGAGLYHVDGEGRQISDSDPRWKIDGRCYGCADCGRYGSLNDYDTTTGVIPVVGIAAELPDADWTGA